MKTQERIFNWLMGASMIWWAIMGLLQDGITPIRAGVSGLNAVIGILFILRFRQQIAGNLKSILISLPSFVVAGLSFRLSPSGAIWAVAPTVLFLVGVSVAMVSFLFLGRNFAILPAVRSIVTCGPYTWVRHPAYLGELLMVAACCWAIGQWYALLLLMALVAMIVLRIHAEESVLAEKLSYQHYSSHIKWRLLPFIW